MAIRRVVRQFGSSAVVTIPAQLVEMYDWKMGQVVEIKSMDRDTLVIQKVQEAG